LTFAEITALQKTAYCHLADGAVLRYEPEQETVRYLAHPATVGDWKQAPLLQMSVPKEGWSHLPGCICELCSAPRGTAN
jgi:hypothetical protein